MSHDPRTHRRLPAARRLPMLALPAALPACKSPIALAADAHTADATPLDPIQVTAPSAKDTGTAAKNDPPAPEVPQTIANINELDLKDRHIPAPTPPMWTTTGHTDPGNR